MAFPARFFHLLPVPSSSQGSYSQVRNALALALWKSHVGNLAPFLIALHNANEKASIILERNDRPTDGRPRTSTTCRSLLMQMMIGHVGILSAGSIAAENHSVF